MQVLAQSAQMNPHIFWARMDKITETPYNTMHWPRSCVRSHYKPIERYGVVWMVLQFCWNAWYCAGVCSVVMSIHSTLHNTKNINWYLPRKRHRRSKPTRSFLLDKAGPVISMNFFPAPFSIPIPVAVARLLLSVSLSWRSALETDTPVLCGPNLSNITTGSEYTNLLASETCWERP